MYGRRLVVGVVMLAACGAPAPGDESADDGAANTGSGESGAGTESSGTGTGTSTESGSGEESGSFMPPGPDVDPIVDCDIWEQDCAVGEKCTAYATMGNSWDANKCVDVMGAGEPGDPCVGLGDDPGVSGLDDCGEGSMCWDIDPDTAVGYCVAFCTGSANEPACASGTLCAIYNNGVLPLCLSTCDPIDPQCESPNEMCISSPGGDGWVCVLGMSGDAGAGDECVYGPECKAGLFCAQAADVPGCMTMGCCSPFCDITQPNTCPGKDQGQQCVALYEQGNAPEGYENLGGCGVP